MVIDTSAILAILLDEPERRRFNEAIEATDVRLLSVANYVEVAIVIESRLGAEGSRDLDQFLDSARVSPTPVDLVQAKAARIAFNRFGKGRHPAGLNYGDCFAYALATTQGEPLLYKGNDFSQTDVAVVVMT
jgi:ribonuclease VapC